MSILSANEIIIASITPHFLERGHLWFEKNKQKIKKASRTQNFWQDNILFLEKDQLYPPTHLLRNLDGFGYEKVQTVESPGEFAHRGGIIDIFPVNSLACLRIEFFGNKIENIQILENTRVENEEQIKKGLKRKLKIQKQFSELSNLKPGDYLVHLDHGIGRFTGMQNKDFYILKYAGGDKLYVPLGLERKLSRYVGFQEPKIQRLGGSFWQNTKRKIKKEVEKLAKELLEIYAKREISFRSPYLKDEEIESALETSFEYLETPDQEKAIEDIKKDMEQEKPMDRVICGDVGFGKTEVALRAMVKAAISGKQAAFLTPTTILCHQHYLNFKKRLEKLPIGVTELSRLQTKKEQATIIEKIKKGEIDIVVGTHRLLSKDISFAKLGLLVIDEEQRFGVKQKEKFKNMRESIDILSLSATPIPRTLYFSLSGLKNISQIQTPPPERLPIKTFVRPFDEKIIKKAIREELAKSGQVYYLHNRVESINAAKNFLETLLPETKVQIAHGQLPEKQLIKVIDDFFNKKINILLATTIIENGIDFPNVNTLIVADGTRLGLAQAHQIRGRIGRSHTQAFAYFLYESRLSLMAEKRLKFLEETDWLGAGYQIAMKDLEMRGAGNILGKEQSGHINQIGLNLYCQMLAEAVEKLK